MRCLLCLFLLSGLSLAQPVDGPWTITDNPGLDLAAGMQLIAESDTTVRLFWQTGDLTWTEGFDVANGRVVGWPTVLSTVTADYWRLLADALAVDGGWAILFYDMSAIDNRTTLHISREDSALTVEIDASANLPGTPIPHNSGSENYGCRVVSAGSDAVVVSWNDAWYWQGPDWGEGGRAFVATLRSLVDGVELLRGEFAAADFESSWPLPDAANGPLVVGEHERAGLCMDSLFGTEYSACFWEETVTCDCDPLQVWLDGTGRVLLISRAGSNYVRDFPARVLVADTANRSCLELLPISGQPIAAAHNQQVGAAWLTVENSGLILDRVTLNGQQHLTPGAIYWTDDGYRITNARLVISDNGTVSALWSEQRIDDPEIIRLRLAACAWDTPLPVQPTEFIPQPASLELATYPNPFNGEATIEYTVPSSSNINLSVFDVLGRKVETLIDGMATPGFHRVMWIPASPSGVYFVQLRSGSEFRTAKLMYLR